MDTMLYHKRIAIVSHRFFEVLKVQMLSGRSFSGVRANEGAVAVVSDTFWKELYPNRDDFETVTLMIAGMGYPVIGVAAANFAYPPDTAIWLLKQDTDAELADGMDYRVPGGSGFVWLGRLKRGVPLRQFRRELNIYRDRLQEQLLAENPRVGLLGTYSGARRLTNIMASRAAPVMTALAGTAALLVLLSVLLVGSVFSRNALNEQPLSVLLSVLGAPRLLVPSVGLCLSFVSALAGTALGLVLAYTMIAYLNTFKNGPASLLGHVRFAPADGGLVLIVGVVLLAVFTLVGAIPLCVIHKRTDSSSMMQHLRGGATVFQGHRTYVPTLILHMSISVVLILTLFMSARHVLAKIKLDTGLDPDGVTVVDAVSETTQGITESSFFGLLSDLAPQHGAWTVGGINRAPFESGGGTVWILTDTERFLSRQFVVMGESLRALGVSLLAGRMPAPNERNVVLVSQSLARVLARGQGSSIRFEGEENRRTVVGIVGDILTEHTSEPEGRWQVYFPFSHPYRDSPKVVKTTRIVIRDRNLTPDSLRLAITPSLERFGMKPIRLRSLDDIVESSLQTEIFQAVVVLMIAVFGGYLVVQSMYTSFSHYVQNRRKDLALRLAVGAAPLQLSSKVIGQGALIASLGLGLGLAAGIGIWQLGGGIVVGLGRIDGLSIVFTALCAYLISFLGCAIPALHAASVSPHILLRED
ncbi:MAG: hypothetical protein OXN90_03355 [Gemmatimonadota bacterium]|nr:hypothetical protein [Gemmatimonadota bacterium]